jgi:hypothetical protein
VGLAPLATAVWYVLVLEYKKPPESAEWPNRLRASPLLVASVHAPARESPDDSPTVIVLTARSPWARTRRQSIARH